MGGVPCLLFLNSGRHSVSAGWTKWNWPICIQSKKWSLKGPGSVWLWDRMWGRQKEDEQTCFLSLVICYAVQSVTLMRQGKPCCHRLIDFWRRPCSQEHCESSPLNLHMANVVSKQVRDAHKGRRQKQKETRRTTEEKMKGKDTWNWRETERRTGKNRHWQRGPDCGQAKGVSSDCEPCGLLAKQPAGI